MIDQYKVNSIVFLFLTQNNSIQEYQIFPSIWKYFLKNFNLFPRVQELKQK